MAEALIDGTGSGFYARVSSEGRLLVDISGAIINIGSVSASVDSIYVQSGAYITGSMFNLPPLNIEGGGKVEVTTSGAVEATFTAQTNSIILSADTSNNKQVYIGKSNVGSNGANAIAFLEAGESLSMGYDDNSNGLFVIAQSGTQNFWKGATVL